MIEADRGERNNMTIDCRETHAAAGGRSSCELGIQCFAQIALLARSVLPVCQRACPETAKLPRLAPTTAGAVALDDAPAAPLT